MMPDIYSKAHVLDFTSIISNRNLECEPGMRERLTTPISPILTGF